MHCNSAQLYSFTRSQYLALFHLSFYKATTILSFSLPIILIEQKHSLLLNSYDDIISSHTNTGDVTVENICYSPTSVKARQLLSKTVPKPKSFARHMLIKADRLLMRETLNAPWLLPNRQFQWTANGHSQLPLVELSKPSSNIDLLCTTGLIGRA